MTTGAGGDVQTSDLRVEQLRDSQRQIADGRDAIKPTLREGLDVLPRHIREISVITVQIDGVGAIELDGAG